MTTQAAVTSGLCKILSLWEPMCLSPMPTVPGNPAKVCSLTTERFQGWVPASAVWFTQCQGQPVEVRRGSLKPQGASPGCCPGVCPLVSGGAPECTVTL